MARYSARLVVGGQHDGEWHEISDDTDYISLLVPSKESFLDYDPRVPQTEMVTIAEAHYKRERLRTPNRTYEFFRHEAEDDMRTLSIAIQQAVDDWFFAKFDGESA